MTGSREQRGFTLVEMLITMLIFSVTLLGVLEIFLRTQRTQKRAIALQRLQSDARFLVNRIAYEFQNGATIDYTGYLNNTVPVGGSEKLALLRPDGKRFYAYPSTNAGTCGGAENTPCLMFKDGAPTAESPGERATSTDMRLSIYNNETPNNAADDRPMIWFYPVPAVDPFLANEQGEYVSNVQPRVTIVMREESSIPGAKDPATISIQTTVSSRAYKR